MKVVEVPVGKITRYWNNPRKNTHAVNAIRRSLDEYGWRQPIVTDKEHVIIVGDTRFQAALLRGDKTVPVHVATDMTPEKVKAYRIADNKLGEMSEWDDAKLMEEITSMLDVQGEVDFSVMGFDKDEMDKLLGKNQPPPQIEDFTVSPTGRTQWIVIHASEEDSAAILSTVRKMKLKSIQMEYSGDKPKA